MPVSAATICRISAHGIRWRVRVESWELGGTWSGRLVFEPDPPGSSTESRMGPVAFHGRSQAEVLDAVHQLPEQRFRELLHSFG